MHRSLISWKETMQKGDFFFQALSNRYISMMVLNMSSRTAIVLSAQYESDIVGCELSWDELMERFVSRRVYQEDQERIFSAFSFDSLALLCDSNLHEKCVEARCQQGDPNLYEWVEVIATAIHNEQAHQILITTRSISEALLHKRVFDQFLFHQNCDFFILVNLNENRYKVFDVRAGLLPIPEMSGENYTADMIQFNRQYVVANDVEKIISLMMPEQILKMLETRDEYTYSCGVLTECGEYRRAKMQIISFDRIKAQVIITRSDITALYLEEKQRKDQLFQALRAAQQDLLTGLYNQATTVEIITKMLESYQGEKAAVMFIDVDNFKLVNDTLGHLQGNIILQKVAKFLETLLKNKWIVGRIGGDEFLLFLSNVSSMQEVHQTGQHICNAFRNLKDLVGDLPVSCSVGISLYPQDGLDYEQLVQKADQALYRSKRYGKNTYSLYAEELEKHQYTPAISKID